MKELHNRDISEDRVTHFSTWTSVIEKKAAFSLWKVISYKKRSGSVEKSSIMLFK